MAKIRVVFFFPESTLVAHNHLSNSRESDVLSGFCGQLHAYMHTYTETHTHK